METLAKYRPKESPFRHPKAPGWWRLAWWRICRWPYCWGGIGPASTDCSLPLLSLPAARGTVEDGDGLGHPAAVRRSSPPTVGEKVSPPPSLLTYFMMCTNRRLEGARSPGNSGRTTDSSTVGHRCESWMERTSFPAPPSPTFCCGKRPAVLCRPAKGGGEKVASCAASQDRDHPGAGPFPPYSRSPRGSQRICDRFHWPGLEAEVKRFCQACPTCQATSPRTPPPSPLIPLPIIEVPFERIGMDIVGPLPKSARGHEHILVIVDYATRYPEAVPLRKATAKSIAQELFLLASRVGLPSEILTDQGTPFMSRLMADLCRLLRVKQLRTTVYHPQTDGLVERFNQTLKQILRRVAAEDKRDWDLMIPYVLFGIREVPQASTGFTPFELLFGRQPRGLLDVAREAWEQQPAPHRTIIEHVRQMRERIDRVMPLVREHLTRAQQAQQRHYNRAAQPREFQPGDRVMVLVPSSACKFLASWKGPYSVVERLGPVTYRLRQLRQPGRRQTEQLYHINLLKKWVGTRDQVAALSLTEPVVVDVNPHLSAAQKTELLLLVSQFQDVFSSQPGQTHMLQHDIRTPPGVVVRQRPYRVPEACRQAIEEEIQQMLKLGVIDPSRSPWSSPIVMVPKPDGTLRFCNDFCRLNEVSEFDGYPMPRVDELLDRLGRARYISTLDLTKGYWQIPLSEAAKPKTAFSNPSGHWQYRTLPFGLHWGPPRRSSE
uniref:Gypsy retrotransposon integrase-like protein 1 n=1 Tax=Cyprinus carpio TaxID=7962 RepID=A0A8C1YTF7_CYPCA